MAFEHIGTPQHLGHRQQQLLQADIRQQLAGPRRRSSQRRHMDIAANPRQAVQTFGSSLVALVLLQPANQLGARIVLFLLDFGRTRQQHARLDLGQHGGHHQILGGQLQAYRLHQLDIAHVLFGDFRDLNIEDVDVLLADQVQQQIQRSLEGFEEHFQSIRRNVQIQR